MITWHTDLGDIIGNERENCFEFLGVRYAKAKRFHYAELVSSFDGTFDGRNFGDACIQKRTYNEHLDIPERMFYHNEFRKDQVFNYSEDCLNMNIYMPKEDGVFPVAIFIHGGGFDSGANSESSFDGEEYAKRGVVICFIQYRVGPLGALTNKTLNEEQGNDGNYGLDDQYKAILWIRKHIDQFKGDKNNITLMGQSAGAMYIQYLCCDKSNEGLFKHVIMMSGGGKFPDFSLPKDVEKQREYWDEVINLAGCKDIHEFEKLDMKDVFSAVEKQIKLRKDNTYHNMPSFNSLHMPKRIQDAIKNPLKVDYMLGFTNNDMYTILFAYMAMKYAKDNNGYTYFFDIDAKGDNNLAFHACDLRYAFSTLKRSWRPYDESDYKVSSTLIDYFTNFIKTGNPNSDNLPTWEKSKNKTLVISKDIHMGKVPWFKLFINTFKGDPK